MSLTFRVLGLPHLLSPQFLFEYFVDCAVHLSGYHILSVYTGSVFVNFASFIGKWGKSRMRFLFLILKCLKDVSVVVENNLIIV